jgi:holliday junction DNA helicase RuvB
MDTNDKADRTFRPAKLDDCLGQDEIRNNLKVYVASAKARNEPIEHMLFCGPAGLGKTTLAGALAAEMGGRLVTVNSPSLKTKGEMAAIIGSLGPGNVLFLDEIHALKRELQEILYPVMEDFKLEIAAGNSTIAIDLAPFTLIGATTHQGKLSKPMRDRFGDVCELRLYKSEELMSIVLRASVKMGFQVTPMAALEIARRAQGTPRVALRLTRRVRDFALSAKIIQANETFVQRVCQQIGIDSAGLDPIARRMLQLLANKGKAVGLQAIAAQLGECLETIEDAVEPFLLASGFVERAQSGRIITPKGAQHLQSCGFLN